ncbi:MAG: TatD family hydrolase [Candidatus Altiarchaeota archaeon]|nr:TatD family hydrolase [Candidatus Altiarchaeota archaeon]
MELVDVHAHLDFKEFDNCRDDVIARARGNSVAVVSAGITPESTRKTLEIARKYDNVFVSLGFMPYEGQSGAQMDLIRENAERIVGIGEVGLDYYWEKDKAARERQKEDFQAVIGLAKELSKPLIVHSRNAEKDCIDILEKNSVGKVIMHCFSGSLNEALRAVGLGFMISIPTNINRSKQKQEFARKLPLESIVLETDAPYLAPEPDSLNEPANILLTAERIAGIKELRLEDVTRRIVDNTSGIFDF